MKKFDIKKAAAVCLSASVAASLTACGENTTWGAVINGEKIPAGVFIYYLDSSNYAAQSKYNEENPSQTDDQGNTIEQPPLYTCSIEGKSARDWVYDKATDEMREYAAVEQKFSEYGLTVGKEEKESTELYADQMWEYAKDYYTLLGVSDSSFKSVFSNSGKRMTLFKKLYSEGGEYAVPESDIKAYLAENYAMINYIEAELRDGEGNLLKSDGKAERIAMLSDYIERYKNGEDFDALNAEYTAYYEQLVSDAAAASAENSLEVDGSEAKAPAVDDEDNIDDGGETPLPEETTASAQTQAPAAETEAETQQIESQLDSVPNFSDIEGQEELPSNRQVIGKENPVPCKEVADKVFDSMNAGDLEIIESADGETAYLVLKMDILENEFYYLSTKDSLLYEMKSEDYDSVIASWVASQTFEKNQKAYDRYDPRKLFGK